MVHSLESDTSSSVHLYGGLVDYRKSLLCLHPFHRNHYARVGDCQKVQNWTVCRWYCYFDLHHVLYIAGEELRKEGLLQSATLV